MNVTGINSQQSFKGTIVVTESISSSQVPELGAAIRRFEQDGFFHYEFEDTSIAQKAENAAREKIRPFKTKLLEIKAEQLLDVCNKLLI